MNEFTVSVNPADRFAPGSVRHVALSASKGIFASVGKLDGKDALASCTMTGEGWTNESAQKWVKDNAAHSIDALVKLYEDHDMSGKRERMVRKFIRATVKAVDKENMTVLACVSTDELDRANEVISQDGWQLEPYKKQPVLLTSHRYNSLTNIIGKALDIQIVPEGMIVKFQYFAGKGNAEADWAWVLAQEKLAAFSVGFDPIVTATGSEIPEKYRGKSPSRVYVKQELLEISQVVVGCNRGALQLGIEEPSMAAAQYAYDVVKSYGGRIPEFTDAGIVAPAKKTVISCGKCGGSFILENEPEVGMGATKCPKCGTVVDQTGKPADSPKAAEPPAAPVIPADVTKTYDPALEELLSTGKLLSPGMVRRIDEAVAYLTDVSTRLTAIKTIALQKEADSAAQKRAEAIQRIIEAAPKVA